MRVVVKAQDLTGGQWFTKLRGTHRHLVVSASAAKYHNLPEGKIYGVSLETGNMTAVDPHTEVVLLEPEPVSVPAVVEPSKPPAAPVTRAVLGCGFCTQCQSGGDCDLTGEPISAVYDDSLDYRF